MTTNRRRSTSQIKNDKPKYSSETESDDYESLSAPSSPNLNETSLAIIEDYNPSGPPKKTTKLKKISEERSLIRKKRAPNESNPKILASLEEDLKRRTAKRRAKMLKKNLVSPLLESQPLPSSSLSSSIRSNISGHMRAHSLEATPTMSNFVSPPSAYSASSSPTNVAPFSFYDPYIINDAKKNFPLPHGNWHQPTPIYPQETFYPFGRDPNLTEPFYPRVRGPPALPITPSQNFVQYGYPHLHTSMEGLRTNFYPQTTANDNEHLTGLFNDNNTKQKTTNAHSLTSSYSHDATLSTSPNVFSNNLPHPGQGSVNHTTYSLEDMALFQQLIKTTSSDNETARPSSSTGNSTSSSVSSSYEAPSPIHSYSSFSSSFSKSSFDLLNLGDSLNSTAAPINPEHSIKTTDIDGLIFSPRN